MKLLEPNEIAEFKGVLNIEGLRFADFVLTEIDTTDPQSDELMPLQGCLTVLCVPTGRFHEYSIGDGSTWLHLFRRDVADRAFAEPIDQFKH